MSEKSSPHGRGNLEQFRFPASGPASSRNSSTIRGDEHTLTPPLSPEEIHFGEEQEVGPEGASTPKSSAFATSPTAVAVVLKPPSSPPVAATRAEGRDAKIVGPPNNRPPPKPGSPQVAPPRQEARKEAEKASAPAQERDQDLAAFEEWEEANIAAERALQQPRPDLISPEISFVEAYNAIRNTQGATWEKYLSPELRRVGPQVETTGFWGCLWSCMHHDIAENSPDYRERDYLLCLLQVGFDHSNAIHRRVLLTIWRRFIKGKKSEPDVPTIGTHWQKLGFQGDNPGTDLRSTGIFGLLQILYLIDVTPHFADALWKVASNPLTAFTFAIAAFNYSGLSIDILKDRSLHDAIANRRKEKGEEKKTREKREEEQKSRPKPAQSGRERYEGIEVQAAIGSSDVARQWEDVVVAEVVCEMYCGLLFQFYSEWIRKPARQLGEFPPIMAKMRTAGRKDPMKYHKNFDKAVFRGTFQVKPQSMNNERSKVTFSEF